MEATTSLQIIIERLSKGLKVFFTWGKFVALHQVGEYSVVEYHPWKSEECVVKTGQPSEEINFHPYIGNRDLSASFSTLDEALAFCIAYKFDGCNTSAHRYFIKGIGEELSKEYLYVMKKELAENE